MNLRLTFALPTSRQIEATSQQTNSNTNQWLGDNWATHIAGMLHASNFAIARIPDPKTGAGPQKCTTFPNTF